MRSAFEAHLVNKPFGDPGLYVDFRREKRALLFDLGDLAPLPPKKLLRVSHVFVSHTHVDHFIGFDRLLRVVLGRHAGVHLYGPPGFIAQVGHKLAAYTWNLVQNYEQDFVVTVTETEAAGPAHHATFRAHERFARVDLPPTSIVDGVLLEEEGLRVRAVLLDHRTPCLGFAIEEKAHVNVWRNRLADMGLRTGPWLTELKHAVIEGRLDDEPFRVWWRDRDGTYEQWLPLGVLKAGVLQIVPGEKICYVTDVVFHDDNLRRIAALADEATLLFIESVFLHEDVAHATDKRHLTARQAGMIARAARAHIVVPFHFSPRYMGREAELRAELAAALRDQCE